MPRLNDEDRLKHAVHEYVDKYGNIEMSIVDFNIMLERNRVDAEPVRHGRWQKERNPMMYQIVPYVFVCDQCGTAFEYDTPYCGECGAKMDEVEDA